MSDESIAFTMGKIEGQLKELIHQSNNTAQKVDALATLAAISSALPADIAAMNVRVTALEVDRNKRDGRDGVLAALLHSRAFGWVVGGVTTAALWINGNIKL